MLESTVWRRYHNENNFREKLAEFCKLDSVGLIADDKELYAALKAKLTKKELKLFAMDTAKVAQETIKTEFDYSDEDLEKVKFKLYPKLCNRKLKISPIIALKAHSLKIYTTNKVA